MRIVRIGDYQVDVVPSRYMIVCQYVDKPGVIGKIGSILGDNGINIGSMQVGRHERKGEALMVLQVDNPVPEEVLKRLDEVESLLSTRFVILNLK